MLEALSFLTPFGGSTPPSSTTMKWFPAVGLAMGLTLGSLWWAAGEVWPLGVAAAVVVLCDLAFTGMLHLDGLVDSADGLLPPLSAERRLEVMADPRAGAFGVGAAGVALLLRWTSLAALSPSPLLLGGLWGASRSGMALAARRVPYARPGGLASAFSGPRVGDGVAALAVIGLVGGGALAAAGNGWGGLAAAVALAATMGAVLVLARRRIGGFTGDVLGAAGIMGETLGLVVAAARW